MVTTQLAGKAPTGIRAQIEAECEAMLRYAFARGMDISPAILDTATQLEDKLTNGDPSGDGLPFATLAKLHGQLAQLVAPALPTTLCQLQRDPFRGQLVSMFGPLPNVRRLTIFALLCTVLFILISLAPEINVKNINSDFYQLNGIPLFIISCLLLTAAGLGAVFNALFTAHGFVAEANYDPRFDSSYWTRIGLGLVAGLLLSAIIPLPSGANVPTLAKPLLALLGGFSAGLVYRVLQRLVDAVESIFQGDSRKMDRKAADLQELTASQRVNIAKLDFAQSLVGLQSQVNQGVPPERLNETLTGLIDDLAMISSGIAAPTPAREGAGTLAVVS